MVLQEPSPIVQLSYSWESLLISSEKRTVLWNFHYEKATQVGQKGEKGIKMLEITFPDLNSVESLFCNLCHL